MSSSLSLCAIVCMSKCQMLALKVCLWLVAILLLIDAIGTNTYTSCILHLIEVLLHVATSSFSKAFL